MLMITGMYLAEGVRPQDKPPRFVSEDVTGQPGATRPQQLDSGIRAHRPYFFPGMARELPT
jgi:hypothetical protein